MRRFRRIVLALVLAVSASMLIPTAPAQAGYPGTGDPGAVELCFPPYHYNPVTMRWELTCVDIYLAEIWKPPCPHYCGPWYRFEPEVNPEWESEYYRNLGEGLRFLIDSRLAEKPELAEQLRNESIEHFLYAAKVRDGVEVELFEVGWIDGETGKIYDDETQMLWKVGENLAAGQQHMMAGLNDPKSIDLGMEFYEAALTGFGMK